MAIGGGVDAASYLPDVTDEILKGGIGFFSGFRTNRPEVGGVWMKAHRSEPEGGGGQTGGASECVISEDERVGRDKGPAAKAVGVEAETVKKVRSTVAKWDS